MSDIRVTLLGGFSVAVDGKPVPDTAWRLKKARELVKLLALAPGHRLHREQAMDVLWRDRSPAAAANNLHQTVYVARRALGADAIDLRDELLHLEADVDVDRLEAAAADARRTRRPAAYRAALSLYTGELLPENRYDDWALSRHEEVGRLAAELERELSELQPASDNQAQSLPADTSSFIGRDRELAELTTLLRGTRLLTLSGTGGAGKTRLALELARTEESSYDDGVVLVELAAFDDPRRVVGAVAAALDVRPLPEQELAAAVVDFLASRSMLLVLDNCEHVLNTTADLVENLLRSAPRLTVLTTSREPLRVHGEVVFRVPSLDIPDPDRVLDPRDLLGYEAARLFVERARGAAPGFELDEENAGDVARICFRLDGLPLALELAAGRLGALGSAAIADRLEDRFSVLRTGSHASPTRQHTLAATLQWSHDLLEPDEQTLFRRLSVFSGGFELDAVERVCTGDALEASDIVDVLARVVEKSLVTADERSSRERRYRLLETVRLYARDRLDDAGETSALVERHAAWALELVEEERGSPRLDRDAANLRVALDTLLARDPESALRFCIASLQFWLRRIDLDEAQRRYEEVLAATPDPSTLRAEGLLAAAAIDFRRGTLEHAIAYAEQSDALARELGDARSEWRALQFLGESGIATDDASFAMEWFDRALALARREKFAAAEAIGIYSLGVVYWILGELTLAEKLVAESLERFHALADPYERIPSPVTVSEIRTSRFGGWPGLGIVFEDTLQPFVEISCEAAVGYVLVNQAGIVRAGGDLTRARSLLDESAARFEDSGDEFGLAATLVRRAYLELAENAVPEARDAFALALELRRRQGDRRGAGLVLAGLGFVDTSDGDYESAERHLAEARDMFRRAGDRWALASTLWQTADLAFARGDLDGAEAALQEARAVLGETKRERWIANTLTGLAEIARLRGDTDRATALLVDARARFAARDDALGVADVEDRLREVAKGSA